MCGYDPYSECEECGDLEPLDLSDDDGKQPGLTEAQKLEFIERLARGDGDAVMAVALYFDDQIPKFAEFRLVWGERHGPFFKYTVNHNMKTEAVSLSITYESGLTGRTLDAGRYTVASVDENTLNIMSNEDLRGMKVSVTRQ